MLADIVHKFIFTSTDMCEHLTPHSVDFVPRKITFHPSRVEWLLGYDEQDPDKKVWLSHKDIDFKLSLKIILAYLLFYRSVFDFILLLVI